MQTQFEMRALKSAILALSSVVQKRPSFPILGHVVITASPDGVELYGTDLEQFLSFRIAANGDSFTVCVDFSELTAFAKLAPASSLCTLDSSGLIRAAQFEKTLEQMPESDMPLPNAWTPTDSGAIDSAALAEALRVTMPCMSTEETRYYLRGVYLHQVNGSAAFCTTDGHRLALHQPAIPYHGENVIIPSETCKTIAKLLKVESGVLSLATCHAQIRLSGSNFTLVSKVVDGTFPDYTRVFPKDNPTYAATVHLDAIPKTKMKFTFNRDESAMCEGMAITSATLSGDVETIAFNAKYLRDLASLSNDKAITLHGNSGSPARVAVTGTDTQFLLMPTR